MSNSSEVKGLHLSDGELLALIITDSLLFAFVIVFTLYIVQRIVTHSIKVKVKIAVGLILGSPFAYSFCAFLNGFWLEKTHGAFEVIANSFEGVTISSFFYLMIWKVGGSEEFRKITAENRCAPVPTVIIIASIQFTLIKLISSILSITVLDKYSQVTLPFVITKVITAISTIFLLIVLFRTFRLMNAAMPHFHCHIKFIVIKVVIFLFLVQSLIFSFLIKRQLIEEESAVTIDSTLRIIEMTIACYFFHYAYPLSQLEHTTLEEVLDQLEEKCVEYKNDE